MSLVVVAAGPGVTVQDEGRPGLGRLGLGRSGAADATAYRLADRLLGQRGRAALEVTLGGLVLEAHADHVLVVTGAPAPASVDGRRVGHCARFGLRAGERLTLGVPAEGLRTYVAVRGGFAVPTVLGSRSTDTLAHLGPGAVRVGDVLPVGDPSGPVPDVDHAPWGPGPAEPTLRLLPGPRADWFADLGALATTWAVTADVSRVGVRLDGIPLRRRNEAAGRELASEGMVAGAVQVPPDGLPIILGPDHPVTGGYPVVAVVADADLPVVARLRPGGRVRLRWS